MSESTLLFGYVAVVLAAIFAWGLHCEFRRRRFEPSPSDDRLFRCTGCNLVYTDDPDVDRSRCPACGRTNEAIKF